MAQLGETSSILLCSSDKENIAAMTSACKSLGVKKLKIIDNGIEAIEVLSKGDFDFVLVDAGLKLIKGWLFIKEVKNAENVKNFPVLLFGKDAPPDTPDNFKQYGVLGYTKMPAKASDITMSMHSTMSLFSTSGTVENKFSRAKDALIKKDSKEAENLYSELRSLTKNSVRSSLGLAQTYVMANDDSKAQVVLEEVAATGDNTPTSLVIKIKMNLKAPDVAKALDTARELVAQVPELFYYNRVVKMFLEVKLVQDVGVFCEEAIAKNYKHPDFYSVLARSSYMNDSFDKAVGYIDAAVTEFGATPEMMNIKGVCFKKTEKFEEALKCYEEALRLAPSDAKVYFNLAVLTIEMGRVDEAIKYLESCVQIAPSFDRAKETLERLKTKVA